MITIGIDPGLSGAIGVLRDGNYLDVLDMPTVLKGSGAVKVEVNGAALAEYVKRWISADAIAILERVNAMPGQGVSGVFSIGDSFGTARGVLAALGVECSYVSPVTWKKRFKLTSDKEESRALASRIFPQAPLSLKKHSDRAEALLMSRYLWEARK